MRREKDFGGAATLTPNDLFLNIFLLTLSANFNSLTLLQVHLT
jgi:hypothetical protein